jgi:hypothetical protein
MLKIFVVTGQFSAHFWVLEFDQSPLIFDQGGYFLKILGKNRSFWSDLWSNARFLPTFKTPLWPEETQYLCGFAGFLPTFPLLIQNYYDKKFKYI